MIVTAVPPQNTERLTVTQEALGTRPQAGGHIQMQKKLLLKDK